MTAKAMIRGVREAVKEIRAMGGQGFVALEECWNASRKAIAELGQPMEVRVASHLAACEAKSRKDRRNGSYPRRPLTGSEPSH